MDEENIQEYPIYENIIDDIVPLVPPESRPIPTFDYAEYGQDWVKGYKNGELVMTYFGVSDISAIQLYNDNNELVIPVPAPLSEVEQLQMAITELTMMFGGLINA